jgi:hypothetical protein
MFQTLKRFLKREPTIESTSPEAFARWFLNSSIHVLCLPIEDEITAGLSQEELLAHIKKAASALSEMQEAKPFTIARDGNEVLALFTSQKTAETFATEYVRESGRFVPFGILGSSGRQLIAQIGPPRSVVLDPASPTEHWITAPEITAIQKAAE